MLQTAAYTAPGMFEQGTALTVQESTPEFAFLPEMPGEVVLGHLWSVETGELTPAQLRLTPERHFHTAFVGDTGFGKTVSAERLAYETTLRWHYRTIVLDFGQGWRKALNWPGLAGRVDIRQLYPGAVRPIRWNPLQVPRRSAGSLPQSGGGDVRQCRTDGRPPTGFYARGANHHLQKRRRAGHSGRGRAV